MSNLLDDKQKELSKKFSKDSWIGVQKNIERLIDWTTFYRRNMNVFIEDYLGISLYWYQIIWIYLLSKKRSVVIVAGRASAKSYVIAIYACAKSVLYANSRFVIASGTKGQAGLIVTEKIQKEILPKSPRLQREIAKIKSGKNDIEVIFKNGSSIVVVPASENARGYRSTDNAREEFRMIDKEIDDSVIQPMQIMRPLPFMTNQSNNGYYEQHKSLLEEESTDIYISSAWRTSHWMWDLINTTTSEMFRGEDVCILATDYSIALKHGIKSFQQMRDARKKSDPITWRQEYENEMIKENTNAYFTYKMFEKNQKIKGKQCFYPRRNIDVLNKKKNPYAIPRQPNEIRLVSWDIAFVNSKKNDNSIFTCIRLIPESTKYETASNESGQVEVKNGYRRVICYIESMKGQDGDIQAIRAKQLYYDFEADYFVMDIKNGGIIIYDRLAKVLYDEERDVEYQAWTCFNDESVADRIKVSGASPILYAVNASQKLNNDIASSFREVLMSGRIDFLVNYQEAVDYINDKIPEYSTSDDIETTMFYENPYHETQALINESISLVCETGKTSDTMSIHEQGANTKDRYTSCSYGSWFASLLEQDLLSDDNEGDFCVFIN